MVLSMIDGTKWHKIPVK